MQYNSWQRRCCACAGCGHRPPAMAMATRHWAVLAMQLCLLWPVCRSLPSSLELEPGLGPDARAPPLARPADEPEPARSAAATFPYPWGDLSFLKNNSAAGFSHFVSPLAQFVKLSYTATNGPCGQTHVCASRHPWRRADAGRRAPAAPAPLPRPRRSRSRWGSQTLARDRSARGLSACSAAVLQPPAAARRPGAGCSAVLRKLPAV